MRYSSSLDTGSLRWDGGPLGRIDGVDRQFDTLRGSGFDSRALQPRRSTRRCEVAIGVLRSGGQGIKLSDHIEAHEAPQQCGASLHLFDPFVCVSKKFVGGIFFIRR